MSVSSSKKSCRAQSAMEYLLLTLSMAALVLVAFGSRDSGLLQRAYNLTGDFHNRVLKGIMGSNCESVLRTNNPYP